MARPSSNMRSGKSRSELQSPLLALPAELRNEIYFYVLGGKAIHMSIPGYPRYKRIHGAIHPIGTHEPSRQPENTSHTLALLQTCRQIHAETHSLPFELNDFYYAHLDISFKVWAETEERVGAIRTVVLPAYRAYGLEGQQNFDSSMAALTGVMEVEVVARDIGQGACEWEWDWTLRIWVRSLSPRASPKDRAAIRDAFGRDVVVNYHD